MVAEEFEIMVETAEVESEAKPGRAERPPCVELRLGDRVAVEVVVPGMGRVEEGRASDVGEAERGEDRQDRAGRHHEREAEFLRREQDVSRTHVEDAEAAQAPASAEQEQPRAPSDVRLREAPRGEGEPGHDAEVVPQVGRERDVVDVGVEHVGRVADGEVAAPPVDGAVEAVERRVVAV